MHHAFRSTWLALSVASLSACYGTAPPRPDPLVLPPHHPSAKITIEEDEESGFEDKQRETVSCPPGHNSSSPACTRSQYIEQVHFTRKYYLPKYDGGPIGLGQLIAMSDPEWRKKEAHATALIERCQQAGTVGRVASIVTAGGLATGVIVYPVLASFGADPVLQWGALGAAGALVASGGAAYGVGYFALGGNSCDEANAEVDAWRHAKLNEKTTRFKTSALDAKAAAARIKNGGGLPADEWAVDAPPTEPASKN